MCTELEKKVVETKNIKKIIIIKYKKNIINKKSIAEANKEYKLRTHFLRQ